MEWQDWHYKELATERLRREASGAFAANAAPTIEQEIRLEIAGVASLKCIPKENKSTVPHVFVHGGGWVFGSSVQSLGLIRRIAWQTRRPVISLDYSLAPEYPYPRAIEDVSKALIEIAGLDGVAGLIGGSAGAQIALNSVSRTGQMGLCGALFFCGAFERSVEVLSNRFFENGAGQLSKTDMQHYLNAYAMPTDAPSPDFKNLPPVFLSVGDSDLLLDDTLQLHATAQRYNGSQLQVVPNMSHGFMNDWHKDQRIDQAVTDALNWLERVCDAHTKTAGSDLR